MSLRVRLGVFVICTVLGLGCLRTERPTTAALAGTFELVRIGADEVRGRESSERRCDERPFYSRYEFTDSTWVSIDSLLAPCAGSVARAVQVISLAGHFQTRGDTVDFYVADARIGERGLVLRGVLNGDTLLLWASDLDGGDYAYARRVRPRQ